MTVQSLLAMSAAGLAALYFIKGVMADLRPSQESGCGTCASGGCPVARKG